MSEAQGRGPADLGASTMPETEDRDPPTRHGETASPGDLDTTAEDEDGLGDKVKGAARSVMGKAKGMVGRND